MAAAREPWHSGPIGPTRGGGGGHHPPSRPTRRLGPDRHLRSGSTCAGYLARGTAHTGRDDRWRCAGQPSAHALRHCTGRCRGRGRLEASARQPAVWRRCQRREAAIGARSVERERPGGDGRPQEGSAAPFLTAARHGGAGTMSSVRRLHREIRI